MGRRDMNEIKLKTALNAIQSIGEPSLLHCQIIKLNKLILKHILNHFENASHTFYIN